MILKKFAQVILAIVVKRVCANGQNRSQKDFFGAERRLSMQEGSGRNLLHKDLEMSVLFG